MKFGRKTITYLIFVLLVAVSSSCLKEDFRELSEESLSQTVDYTGFDFKTTQEVNVDVTVLNIYNQAIDGVSIELFTENPLNNLGQLNTAINSRVFNGVKNKSGKMNSLISPATSSDSLYLLLNNIGLPGLHKAPLTGDNLDFVIGGSQSVKNNIAQSHLGTSQQKSAMGNPVRVNGFLTLGTWNTLEVPDYLEAENDVITNNFLADVNATLPEYERLPVSHPQYFTNADEGNLILEEPCSVWITFVHEGAGWKNSLGYYTYQTENPPVTSGDVSNPVIAFPITSYLYSNGGLISGNKVQLQYLDPVTQQFTSVFPGGVTIGWFLVAQGWSSNSGEITQGRYSVYSNENLNPVVDTNLRKHSVLLYDQERDLFLLAFEDIRRDHGGDGNSDVFDHYPLDPDKAFNNYYPSEGVNGTLVFEDLWPYRGDYDFNDMVVDYKFNQVTNANNEVTAVESKIIVRAIGVPGNPYSVPDTINLNISFDYPAEKQKITNTHLMFNNWAISLGYSHMDWCQYKSNYRNTRLIYSK